MEILPIDNGHRDKLPKHRIISLIGVFFLPHTDTYNPYIQLKDNLVLANATDYASFQERTVS